MMNADTRPLDVQLKEYYAVYSQTENAMRHAERECALLLSPESRTSRDDGDIAPAANNIASSAKEMAPEVNAYAPVGLVPSESSVDERQG